MGNKSVVIGINHVTIRFNLANQKVDNLKGYLIKLVKGELMFQEFLAVRDISFQIHVGESQGVIGISGSGKSTLLEAISGILKPYHGGIIVKGNVVPLIELSAGFGANMTVRENIFLSGYVLGHTEKYMKERFDKVVDFAELWDFLDSPIRSYSSGMRTRLGFATATMVEPNILVIDEILTVGDYKFHRECEQRMNAMLEGGATLFYVSHSIDEARRLCDRVIWLEEEAVHQIGEAQKACDEYVKCMSIK